MNLITELGNKEISLEPVSEADLQDFILTEKTTHNQYVAGHKDFFGEWNEDILLQSFNSKRNSTFFKKMLQNGEIIGYLGYDRKDGRIDNTFIRIKEKAQNKGIGTVFLSYLMELSGELGIPVYLVVIKTNPAQNLYRRLGFECYEEKDVFYCFRYIP